MINGVPALMRMPIFHCLFNLPCPFCLNHGLTPITLISRICVPYDYNCGSGNPCNPLIRLIRDSDTFLTTHVSQLTTHVSRLTTHNSQLTTHNSQLTTHNSQLTFYQAASRAVDDRVQILTSVVVTDSSYCCDLCRWFQDKGRG